MRPEERRWRRHVCAILRRGGVNRDDLEDLCQEVAIAYFRTRGAAPWEDASPHPYLLAHLIKSALSDYFAQFRRHSQLIARYTFHIALDRRTPDRLAIEQEAVNRLYDLPPKLREVIEMKVFHGYTFPEISDLTSCPEGAVKARYYKGIAILRKTLHEDTTFSPRRGINKMDTNDEEVENRHVSEDALQDSANPDGRWGG